MRALLLLLVMLVSFANVAHVQSQPDVLAERRARWERLSPEERTTLRARFERLKDADPERRASLERRAQELRRREDRLRGRNEFRIEFERRTGRSIQDAPSEEVRSELRRFRRHRDHELGRSLRGKLPPELRAELEAASPSQREALLARFVRERRAKHHDRMLGAFARRLELSTEEVESVRTAEPSVRRRLMGELHRRVIERGVAEHGLGDVSPAEWESLQVLDVKEFLDQVRHLKLPRPPGARGRRGPGGRGGSEHRRPSRRDGPPFRQ